MMSIFIFTNFLVSIITKIIFRKYIFYLNLNILISMIRIKLIVIKRIYSIFKIGQQSKLPKLN